MSVVEPSQISQLPLPPAVPLLEGYRLLRRSPPEALLQIARDYGDLVRWRGFQTIYCLNHPEYVRQVLTQSWPRYSKDTIDYRVVGRTLGKGLVTNDGPDWAKQRRLMQPVFANRAIDKFDAVINEMTTQLADSWVRKRGDETVWLDRDMSRVTFQVVSRTLFGADIDDAADEMTEILHIVNQHPLRISSLLTLYPWLPVPSNHRFARIKARLDAIVDGLVEQRRAQGEQGRGDIVDRLLAARDADSGEGMSPEQMRDELITLLLAGHETSATALVWTYHLLGQHPEIEARLVEELERELGGRAALSADLPRLPYLKQVVQESMRLYPPVWGIARRANEDAEFGGYRVPAGAYISISMYALHRHPEYWPNADRFDPERFDPKRNEQRHSYCYIPFSAGPRACIGASMAMLEIQLVLAQLLQRFRVTPVPGFKVTPQAVVTFKTRAGMPVTITPR
jgi:cytochrome P450